MFGVHIDVNSVIAIIKEISDSLRGIDDSLQTIAGLLEEDRKE